MTPPVLELEDFTPGSKRLRFMLAAERKQKQYADQRYAHTEAYRRHYQQWQREVATVRARLIVQIKARSQTDHTTPAPARSDAAS